MKAYTDLQQSKKLAKILPIESADMFFCNDGSVKLMWEHLKNIPVTTPCWSLSALIEALPKVYLLKPILDLEENSILYSGTDLDVRADNIIDACYEMLLKLNSCNLL